MAKRHAVTNINLIKSIFIQRLISASDVENNENYLQCCFTFINII